jgi:hypothetical protein
MKHTIVLRLPVGTGSAFGDAANSPEQCRRECALKKTSTSALLCAWRVLAVPQYRVTTPPVIDSFPHFS